MAFCAYCGTPVSAVSNAPCATCSNPTNGAPKRAAIKGGGVVVVVVAVLLAIGITIFSSFRNVAIQNLLTAMQRSKQERTMSYMQTIAAAVEAYARNNNNRYPEATSVDQLAQKLKLTTVDGWGNPLHYACWSSSGSGGCDTYAIVSAGKDGKFEEEDLANYKGRAATTNFDDDIVLKNGRFIQAPEVPQGR